LNISHTRMPDLRIKVIAPSGRTVEVETGLERASSNDDIRIASAQFDDLLGESLTGTWSISVRDEALGVAGQLVGWNLKLNSQGAVEYFQRGLNIPDPVERETDNIWFDSSGRYAVARAMQSDSARIWDLTFAEPVRAIALPESEKLIGLDATAHRLISASQDRVNLWDTATGGRSNSIPVGAASSRAALTPDRTHLFVERRGDVESRFELWNLDDGAMAADFVVAGVPALVAINASGSRVAIADFDRSVRIWDFQSARLLGQFDLPAQPAAIRLSGDGSTLGAVYPDVGVTVWNTDRPQRAMLEEFGGGNWQLAFSPSGNVFAAGRPDIGFQIYRSSDGRLFGPPLGVRSDGDSRDLLAFSQDEQVLITGDASDKPRIWRVPGAGTAAPLPEQTGAHVIWSPAGDRPVAVASDGAFVAIGDPDGHVHIVVNGTTLDEIAAMNDDLSFVGHNSEVRLLAFSPSGLLVASVAKDNSVRFWDTGSGEPLATIVDLQGPPVTKIRFSPNSGFVALLSGSRITVINVSDGKIVAEHQAADSYTDLTFAAEDQLYLGSGDGELQLLNRGPGGVWSLRQVWQGPNGIRLLRASPRGDFLILVDQNNLASQFNLSEGRVGEATLQLPSNVQEVSFSATGTRSYFRTSRWVHLASSSISGLMWMDALLVPQPLRGAEMVQGNGIPGSVRRGIVYLPVARNGYIELVGLDFGGTASVGLFGKRDERLQEWSNRINATPPEGS
jgi:WD40 repeat protein